MSAICDWLDTRGGVSSSDSLFISLDHPNGGRLQGRGIHQTISLRSKQAGITKQMSPHRVRHSAITAYLDASGGDVRSAQGLSRHKNLNRCFLPTDCQMDIRQRIMLMDLHIVNELSTAERQRLIRGLFTHRASLFWVLCAILAFVWIWSIHLVKLTLPSPIKPTIIQHITPKCRTSAH